MPNPRAVLDADISLRDGAASLVVVGELDAATAVRLRALVAGIVSVPAVARVDVDCGGLRFVDSAGLHALLRSQESAWRAGVEWFLGPTSPSLRRLLEIVGAPRLHDAWVN